MTKLGGRLRAICERIVEAKKQGEENVCRFRLLEGTLRIFKRVRKEFETIPGLPDSGTAYEWQISVRGRDRNKPGDKGEDFPWLVITDEEYWPNERMCVKIAGQVAERFGLKLERDQEEII